MKKKILIVEDEPDVMTIVSTRLELAGYDISTAANGLLALEQIKIRMPDLVITDVLMPDMDGFGLVKELKNNPATAQIPIIVLTARTKMGDTFAAIGTTEFLTKPFEVDQLLATVSRQFSNQSGEGIKPQVAEPPPIAPPKKAEVLPNIIIAGHDSPAQKSILQFITSHHYQSRVLDNDKLLSVKAKDLEPVMILLEIPTQGIHAQEVVRSLKNSPTLKKVPLVLYSVFAEDTAGGKDSWQRALNIENLKDSCIEAGANDYLGSLTAASQLDKILKHFKK